MVRPTRNMGPRSILTYGLGGTFATPLDYGETADITDEAYDDVADAGVLDEVARADHLHGMPSAGGGGGGAFVGWLAQRTADQTGVATATFTAVSFTGTDISDTSAFHDPGSNPSRATIPSGKAGVYRLSTYVIWDGGNAAGRRQLLFYKNGAAVTGGYGPTMQGTTAFFEQMRLTSDPLTLAVGDYVEVMVFQDSGGNRTLSGSVVPLTFGGELIGT